MTIAMCAIVHVHIVTDVVAEETCSHYDSLVELEYMYLREVLSETS